MQMDHLARNGRPEKWVENDLRVNRRVLSLAGDALTLEVSLTDSFDSKFYSGVRPAVTPVEVAGQMAETCVDNLRIVAPDAASISTRRRSSTRFA
jgi:hypothetical protein